MCCLVPETCSMSVELVCGHKYSHLSAVTRSHVLRPCWSNPTGGDNFVELA